ncbi:MAG: hypothetical protein U0Q16_25825 [Bryobacteraceae bacterium]
MTRDEIRTSFAKLIAGNPRARTDRSQLIASWRDWFGQSPEEESAREFVESLLDRGMVRQLMDKSKGEADVLLPSVFAECKAAQLGKDPVWICWAVIAWAQALRVVRAEDAITFESKLLGRGMAESAAAGVRSGSVSRTVTAPLPPLNQVQTAPKPNAAPVPAPARVAPSRIGWAIAIGVTAGIGVYSALPAQLAIEQAPLCAGRVPECRGGDPIPGSRRDAPGDYTLVLHYRGAQTGMPVEVQLSQGGEAVKQAHVLEQPAGHLPVYAKLGPGVYRVSVISGGVERASIPVTIPKSQ